MNTASNVQVREHNTGLVRKALLRTRRATKPQLAAATGLSQMTVAAALAVLLENGEVETGAQVPSGGGRPSTEYCYRGGFRKTAVLYSYFQQDTILARLLVVDLFGDCVYRDNRALETVEPDSFDRMLARAFESVEGIGAIGLGLPGRAVAGEIVSNDYQALVGKRLLQRYERLYGVPVMFVNDTNAAAWGCHLRTREEERAGETLAALYFPERYWPGMGLIVNGCLHTGHRNFVGEFYHLPNGQDWSALDYGDEGAVTEAAARLLAEVCCVAAPDRFALYGSFFHPGMAEAIRERAEQFFSGRYGLRLETRRSLERDYEAGMRALSLLTLKRSAFGGTWEE